jgi:hypothetical protein
MVRCRIFAGYLHERQLPRILAHTKVKTIVEQAMEFKYFGLADVDRTVMVGDKRGEGGYT